MSVMATARTAVAAYPHIEKTPGVCGGKPCIEGTRIRVLDIAGRHRRGIKPEDMLDTYAVRLTLAQVYSALAYYHDHKAEIEAEIREDRKVAAQIERGQARFLKQRRAR